MAKGKWKIKLPADRLEELEAKMLTTSQTVLQHYRPLTRSINVFHEWDCLQRIVEPLRRNKTTMWGYVKVNPNGKRDGGAVLRAVEVWRIMPHDMLTTDQLRHRRWYKLKRKATS